MSALELNAEALYAEFARGIRSLLDARTRVAGIVSGGWWLAERLGMPISTSELSQYAGALGAALIARERRGA